MGHKNVRPGFLLSGRYQAQSNIKRVICDEEKDNFVSFDQLGLQLWKLNPGNPVAVNSKRLQFPRTNFVTCMTFISGPKLVACACLDGNLRLYKYNLKLKSTLPWGETAVFDMHHVPCTNEIIVSGTQGVKIYCTQPDYEAYARSVKDPEDVVSAENNPWAFGQCQAVKVRMKLEIPSLQAQHPDSYHQAAKKLWVYSSCKVVFITVCGSLYGFNVMDGTCIATWDNLHARHISSFVYLPDRKQAVSICEAPKAIVWKVQSWKVNYVRTFGAFASLVTALERVPDAPSIIIATQDGSMKMWCMETFQHQVSIKVASGITDFCFATKQRAVLWHESTAHVLSLRCMFPPLLTCTSPVILLYKVLSGSILALFEDDSSRLVDPASGKTILSVPPQLASQSVISCAWSVSSHTMYMLLSNSIVHVWQPMSKSDRAQLVAIWCQHRRSRMATLTIVMQQTIPAAQLRLWGISSAAKADEFLFAGTFDGDVLIMDRSSGCQLISFCAHKLCPIQQILSDHRQQRVLTIAGSAARVWSFKSGVRSMGTTNLGTNGTSAALCGSNFVVGTASGSIHIVESKTGLCTITLSRAVHTSTIHSMHADEKCEWIVSSSADGTVKVWKVNGVIIASLQNTRRVACACFLNDSLDILLGAHNQLEVVRYREYVSPNQLRSQETYESMRCGGKNHQPKDQQDTQACAIVDHLKSLTLSWSGGTAPSISRMTETNATGVPIIGLGLTALTKHKEKNTKHLPSNGDAGETSSAEEDFRTQVLQHAEHYCMLEHGVNRGNNADSSVEAGLQPRLKKVLKVLEDPDMFWDGTVPTGACKKRSTRRRRRGRKKPTQGSITALLARANEDTCLHEAIKELQSGDQQLKLSLRKTVQ